jgi:transposase-like protein
MKENITRTAVCPRCGKEYTGRPALSRADNQTPLCPDCGTREALESIGVDSTEQEKILDTIHRNMQQ